VIGVGENAAANGSGEAVKVEKVGSVAWVAGKED
jgi:hypothetical protein